jgi:hypothetical protein
MHPLTISVALLAMRGEVAIVRLTLQPASGGAALRQTRLYQNGANGWQRLAPSAALWGSPRHRQSRYFDFHYYAQDEEAVAAVAAMIDTLYERMTINFLPLEEKSTAALIPIEVDPTQPYGVIATRNSPGDALVVASPALYGAPVTLSESQLLAQSIILSLLNESRIQAIEHYRIAPRWQPFVAALHLWQLWQLELPLAEWRGPLVRWVLAEPQTQLYRLEPAFAPQLCAMHRLWMSSPQAIQIPISCTGDDWAMLATADGQVVEASPVTLAQLLPADPGPLSLTPPRPAYAGAPVVMTTLFDYIAARYGKPRLMLMVQSLHEQTSWESLIPAVFGLSASDFEQRWRTDLAARYPLSCRSSGAAC